MGRFQKGVEELELGGDWRCECPIGTEELFMLLPEGAENLAGVRKLVLWCCGNQVDDEFLDALSSAGCGENLTDLILDGVF